MAASIRNDLAANKIVKRLAISNQLGLAALDEDASTERCVIVLDAAVADQKGGPGAPDPAALPVGPVAADGRSLDDQRTEVAADPATPGQIGRAHV